MPNQLYLLSFIIGVISAYQWGSLPSQNEVIWLVSFPCLLFAYRRLQTVIIALISGIFVVFLAASYHQSKHLSSQLWQVPQEIEILIQSYSSSQAHLQRYQVQSSTLNQSFALSHYVPEAVMAVGRCYRVMVKLKPKHALGNPTSAAQTKNQWAKREFIQGHLMNKTPIMEISCPEKWFDIALLRQQVGHFIRNANISMTGSAILQALVLGNRAGIVEEHWEILQKTGTAHLLAISGLHIGLVYLFAYGLSIVLLRPLGLIFLRMNMLIVSSGFALLASGFYVLLSGAGVSSLRAWGMLALITVLRMRRSSFPALYILWVVLALILLFDPLAGMGMGLWLSAGAVFALIWLQAGKWQVHWKLAVMMLPISALWLSATWLSPVANGFAIPWVSFLIVPGALLSVLFHVLGFPGADFLMQLTGHQIDYLWSTLTWLAPHAGLLQWSLLNTMDIAIFFTLFIALLFPWRLVGLVPFLILFGALTWPKPSLPEPGTVLLHVIDAGQGTALLIQWEDKNLLFDVGSLIVADYLQHYRIKKLDTVVISHNDNDHRVGLSELLKKINVGNIYAGENLRETAAFEYCRAGQTWSWGELQFQFLSPVDDRYRGNNASCVLKISLGDQSFLFTGDIERKVEKELLSHGDLLLSTVLIAPHHGSKTSSTLEFINAVSPSIVIYPTGFLNPYHHPHPDIVARYDQINVQQYNTAQDGALRVKLSKHGIEEIRCYLKDHRYWWSTNEETTCSGYLAQAEH